MCGLNAHRKVGSRTLNQSISPGIAALQTASRRSVASLCAGAIAIAINVAALWSADLFHVQTAHGGLLKLLVQLTGLPAPRHGGFDIVFHVVVGLVMAVVYGLLLKPLWRWPPWLLGVIYAAVTWIANAFVVLPIIGEGIAGSFTLSTAGILWFAAAHTVFFVTLALLYEGCAFYVATFSGSHLSARADSTVQSARKIM